MNKINLKSLAKRQWQDYQQNNPGTFFSTEKNTLSLEEAYKVQVKHLDEREKELKTELKAIEPAKKKV